MGVLTKLLSPTLMNELQAFPLLRHKMPFRNKYASLRINLATLINLDTNMSHRYSLLCWSILDAEIGIAPAYLTRILYNIPIGPTPRTFNNPYLLLCLPFLISKTRETPFQVFLTEQYG